MRNDKVFKINPEAAPRGFRNPVSRFLVEHAVGFPKLDRIVTTGDFAIGFPCEFTDPGFLEEYSRAGVMICMGMANYESLSDRALPVPTAFLLRAKCRPVAASLNVPVGTNTVRIKRAL